LPATTPLTTGFFRSPPALCLPENSKALSARPASLTQGLATGRLEPPGFGFGCVPAVLFGSLVAKAIRFVKPSFTAICVGQEVQGTPRDLAGWGADVSTSRATELATAVLRPVPRRCNCALLNEPLDL